VYSRVHGHVTELRDAVAGTDRSQIRRVAASEGHPGVAAGVVWGFSGCNGTLVKNTV